MEFLTQRRQGAKNPHSFPGDLAYLAFGLFSLKPGEAWPCGRHEARPSCTLIACSTCWRSAFDKRPAMLIKRTLLTVVN